MNADAEIARLKAEIKRLDQVIMLNERAWGQRTADATRAVEAALAAAEKATTKAEFNQRQVNETQNEFRGSLRDQGLTMMPRSEAENTYREIRDLITRLTEQFNELRSRVDVGPPTHTTLQTRSDEEAGRHRGQQNIQAALFALAGIVIAAIAILTR
jgi:chromosome segregation ATPase